MSRSLFAIVAVAAFVLVVAFFYVHRPSDNPAMPISGMNNATNTEPEAHGR